VYDIYARSVRNLGSPVFPRRLFRAVFEAFDTDCQVLAVWREERIVAGVVTLFYEDQVLPYYGAALRDCLPYAVNDFMYWELMCHAADAGYRVFDFGRSREGTGSYDFKRHWGFEPVPLPYQYVMLKGGRLPDLSPSNPRLRVATDVWKRLPLAVTNALGPVLTRYLP
jgi:FemAB-related protein (PEP-CTERM system-associated)